MAQEKERGRDVQNKKDTKNICEHFVFGKKNMEDGEEEEESTFTPCRHPRRRRGTLSSSIKYSVKWMGRVNLFRDPLNQTFIGKGPK